MTTKFRDKKKFATVDGKQMAYIKDGNGDPIVFLHGNPTSSYLCRNVMPIRSARPLAIGTQVFKDHTGVYQS